MYFPLTTSEFLSGNGEEHDVKGHDESAVCDSARRQLVSNYCTYVNTFTVLGIAL